MSCRKSNPSLSRQLLHYIYELMRFISYFRYLEESTNRKNTVVFSETRLCESTPTKEED